jgi:hypothetical protein
MFAPETEGWAFTPTAPRPPHTTRNPAGHSATPASCRYSSAPPPAPALARPLPLPPGPAAPQPDRRALRRSEAAAAAGRTAGTPGWGKCGTESAQVPHRRRGKDAHRCSDNHGATAWQSWRPPQRPSPHAILPSPRCRHPKPTPSGYPNRRSRFWPSAVRTLRGRAKCWVKRERRAETRLRRKSIFAPRSPCGPICAECILSWARCIWIPETTRRRNANFAKRRDWRRDSLRRLTSWEWS